MEGLGHQGAQGWRKLGRQRVPGVPRVLSAQTCHQVGAKSGAPSPSPLRVSLHYLPAYSVSHGVQAFLGCRSEASRKAWVSPKWAAGFRGPSLQMWQIVMSTEGQQQEPGAII